MRDPIPAPALLVKLTTPLAEKLSLSTLPYHTHEIALGFLWYHFILYVLSPAVSRAICPRFYNAFNKRTRLNWDIHCVSMVQALFINAAALYVIFTDRERKEMDWTGRLWGYTPASGMVQGFAAGTLDPSFLPFRLALTSIQGISSGTSKYPHNTSPSQV